MKVNKFIEAEKQEQGNVSKACRLLKVSRSAYYEWSKQKVSSREGENLKLTAQVKELFEGSRRTYGAPRIVQILRRRGYRCGRKRIARLMAQNGWVARCPKRFKKTTEADPLAQITAVDLLRRNFKVKKPNRIWVGDITYIRTWQGWMYLATVIDLYSRRVVGWAMAQHMRAELVVDALKMAIRNRCPNAGLIFHSDRGSQYTSKDYCQLLCKHKIRQSLSRPGQCWDNAVAESFFSTLKAELISCQSWPNLQRAFKAISEFIEIFYNRQRIHSTLGYLSPAEFEEGRLILSHAA